jgi:hypothetical protein
MRATIGYAGLLVALCTSCVVVPVRRPDAWPSDWATHVGRVVTLTGTAEETKSGPVLLAGEKMIFIDGLDSWPEQLQGKRLRVRGKVISRDDLPVYVQKPDELPRQGMPVSSEAEANKRKWRYLLQNAKWERLD